MSLHASPATRNTAMSKSSLIHTPRTPSHTPTHTHKYNNTGANAQGRKHRVRTQNLSVSAREYAAACKQQQQPGLNTYKHAKTTSHSRFLSLSLARARSLSLSHTHTYSLTHNTCIYLALSLETVQQQHLHTSRCHEEVKPQRSQSATGRCARSIQLPWEGASCTMPPVSTPRQHEHNISPLSVLNLTLCLSQHPKLSSLALPLPPSPLAHARTHVHSPFPAANKRTSKHAQRQPLSKTRLHTIGAAQQLPQHAQSINTTS